jgi:plasmid stabilization system protein ParE
MVPVVWTGPAAIDLQEVHDYIARDSPRYAQRTVEQIQHDAARLARFPRLSQALPEFPNMASTVRTRGSCAGSVKWTPKTGRPVKKIENC